MATLREIRQKLHSVGNIRKITQAMEMVASSRLRKAQSKAESSRPYALKLKEILDHLIAASDDLKDPLIAKREVKKTGVVIVAADKGLCGGYNYDVFSAAEKFLSPYDSNNVELITVGQKTLDYFGPRKWPVTLKVADWGGKITLSQIEEFTRALINFYLNKNLDEIYLVYTHFINVSSRKVKIDKFLNIDTSNTTRSNNIYIFEPDAETIFSEILPLYCMTKIQAVLNDAYASELAARIASMRTATKNTEEMIETLTLTRNKVRQAAITRELIEVMAGAT